MNPFQCLYWGVSYVSHDWIKIGLTQYSLSSMGKVAEMANISHEEALS